MRNKWGFPISKESKDFPCPKCKHGRWILAFLVAFGLLMVLATQALAEHQEKYDNYYHEMIETVVQLKTNNNALGGGVVIYSDGTMDTETLILTVQHLTAKAKRLGGIIMANGYEAEIIAEDEKRDLALLRIYEPMKTVHLSRDRIFFQGEPVYLSGSGMGYETFVTEGRISLSSHLLKGVEMIMTSAPGIYGNSGGGLFRKVGEHYVFIGIMMSVSTAPIETPYITPFPLRALVPHMSWVIHLNEIKAFLGENGYDIM